MANPLIGKENLSKLAKALDDRSKTAIALENSRAREEEEKLNQSILGAKAELQNALFKTSQTLTDAEKDQVRKNLGFIGRNLEGTTHTVNGTTYTAGKCTEIFGDYDTNIAIGNWSIAEGSETIALGPACHAEGAQTQALGTGCHTEGVGTQATGYWSHAEGELTIVSSYASHAEGSYTTLPDNTKRYGTASGYASHIEGGGCYASGSCAHAEGLAVTVSGNHSHGEGKYTTAASSCQHVEGCANIADTENKYIHIAGNGSWDSGAAAPTYSNAYTLDWDGNGWFAGNVTVGADNKELATKEYVDTSVSDYLKLNEDGDLAIDGDVIANNIPKIISEDTILTISAEVLQNAVDNQLTEIESVSFIADASKPVYADFGGKVMTSTVVESDYIEFFVADPRMTTGFALVAQSGKDLTGDNPDKSKITLRVLKDLQITDLKLYQLEVNTISSMCLEHDLNIINSLSMNRRGDIGQFSTALGGSCLATGQYSIAAGLASSATGAMSVALGRGCSASGTSGLATGQMCSVAQEGFATGRQSSATGRAASALGNYNVAKGAYSLAEGDNCQANGSTSHAEGLYTIAGSAYQHVQGKYNVSDTGSKYAHIVGNGTADNARSNAHTIDWNGNGWFAGKVTAVGVPTEANDLVNKDYVDNKLSTIDAIKLNGYSIWVGTTDELPSEEDRDPNTLYFEIGEEEETDDVVENHVVNGVLTLTTDKYQKVLNIASGTEIVFPNVNKYTEIHLFFISESAKDLILPDECKWRVDVNIEAGYAYELIFKYNTLCWLADIIVYS